MPRKLFTSPTSQFLTGDNARPLNWIFRALNEYFRTHIGFWGEVSGTTDANGDLTITHNCGFEPAVVLLTEQDAGDTTKMGPYHIETFSSSTIVVHFFDKNGNDRVSHNVRVHYMLLPDTTKQ